MLYAKTLYGMFLREMSWINAGRRQTRQLASAVLVLPTALPLSNNPRWIPQQPSSGVIPLLGTLVPTLSHRLVPLFSSCSWLWSTVFLHTVKGTAAHSWSQPFWGLPPLQSHAHGKRGGRRKGSSR